MLGGARFHDDPEWLFALVDHWNPHGIDGVFRIFGEVKTIEQASSRNPDVAFSYIPPYAHSSTCGVACQHRPPILEQRNGDNFRIKVDEIYPTYLGQNSRSLSEGYSDQH
jgi:hypothetical protein